MPPTQPLPPKKEVALALLERSNDRGIYVHLDPRRTGVAVPAWFKKQPQLVLQIGLNMAIPIPDLRLDDEGMSCTLSFSRSPFYCQVPWSSVFAIVGDDAKGMVWPDDVPAEITRQTQVRAVESPPRKEGWKPEPAGKRAKRSKKRSPLTAVSDEPASVAPVSPPVGKAKAVRSVQTPPVAPAPAIVPPSPASRPGAGASRKKRELPPYLRVVK